MSDGREYSDCVTVSILNGKLASLQAERDRLGKIVRLVAVRMNPDSPHGPHRDCPVCMAFEYVKEKSSTKIAALEDTHQKVAIERDRLRELNKEMLTALKAVMNARILKEHMRLVPVVEALINRAIAKAENEGGAK